MRRFVLMTAVATLLGVPAAGLAQVAAAGTSLGSITLNQRVMADGKPLAAGTYQVRLTGDSPKPGPGQSMDGTRYVEFVRGGKVLGRELATIVLASEIDSIAESRRPAAGNSRVERLKGDDYVRVWINRGGTNYIINMPPT